MKKRILLGLAILLALFLSVFLSCSEKEKVELVKVKHIEDQKNIDREVISFTSEFLNDDVHRFYYEAESPFTYIVSMKENASSIIRNENDTVSLHLQTYRTYHFEEKTFHVLKLVENEFVIDGAIDHYVCFELGFLFKKSGTWLGFTEVFSPGNHDLTLLKSIVHMDLEFIFGDNLVYSFPPPSEPE